VVVIWTSFSSASILSCVWSSQSFLFFPKFKKVIHLLFWTILQLLSLLLSQSCAVQLQHHNAIYFVRLWDVHKQKYCHIKYTKHTVTILHVHWRHWGFLNWWSWSVSAEPKMCCTMVVWNLLHYHSVVILFINLMISKTLQAKMNQTHYNWKDFCL